MSRLPCIAVVDEREFRRAGLMRLLEPWANIEKSRIISFAPEKVEQLDGENFEFRMLIFGIGGELLFESKILGTLEMLRSRIPNTPLVIISDREDDHDVAIAMSKGVQGYIFSGINSVLAFQALSFILHGGMYFPPSAFRNLQAGMRDGLRNKHVEMLKRESGILPSTNDTVASIVSKNNEEDFIWSNLTPRQRQVLEYIRLGESNKMIGRHLGMTEGTVKVHVRQIMRKVGASNRTQLAIGKRTHLMKKIET